MTSIEQDDIFNIQDDEMLDEDDGQQDYDMGGDNDDDGEDNGAGANDDGEMEDSDGAGDDGNQDNSDDDSNEEEDGNDEDDEGNEDDEDDEDDGNDEDDDNEEQEDTNEEANEDIDNRGVGTSNGENEDESIQTKPERSKAEQVDKVNTEESNDKMDVDEKEDGGNKDNFSHLTPREKLIQNAKIATEFDIVPSVAIPYSTQCHTLAFTDGPKWILTGGEDGFIRKYDFISSIQGKTLLTTAQKQNLVDSVTKAGVIATYWENEQPLTKKQMMASNPKLKASDFSTGIVTYEPKVNPVYSLEAERNGYWCLSGLSSGGIALYTMRHNEGSIHHYFPHGDKNKDTGHKDTVSVLKLNQKQDKLLSGSWDKSIRHWDLNTGDCITKYSMCTGQISNIQYRPQGLTDLVLQTEDASNDGEGDGEADGEEDVDSLFGDSDDDDDERKPATKKEKNNSAHSKVYNNESIFMSSSIDGTINIWDVRTQNPVMKFGNSEGVPPWCMSSTWSNCGDFIYAGRRNSTVEEFSIKMPHKRFTSGHAKDVMVPNVLKLLQFPKISGPVSAISTMPNNDFILCGSSDNIRLYNLKLYDELGTASTTQKLSKKPATPFLIIPGHQGGVLSCLYVDETGRFMVSASGNRGWGHANYTESVIVYEIDFEG